MFNWLEGLKDQLNLLIQALLFVATLVLIRVGWKQAKAADAQAKAADAQVAAANEQVATAKAQLSMSMKEMYANLSAADLASRPILHVVAIPNYEDKFLGSLLVCDVTNIGLGPALSIEAFYGSDPSDAAGLFGNSIGVGERRREEFENHRVKKDQLTIHYKSTHGSTYSTMYFYFEESNEFIELHKLEKNVFQEIAEAG
jgi:hypothetical protein